MNRYRFKVYEWNGNAFHVLLHADNYGQAMFWMFALYPDAPAIESGQLIEGSEPLSIWTKILNLFRRKP